MPTPSMSRRSFYSTVARLGKCITFDAVILRANCSTPPRSTTIGWLWNRHYRG